jgi:putative hydrolase of the HAD superfamily
MRRPALIFDFGNVIAFFDYARACAVLGRRLGLSGEEFLLRARSAGLDPLVQQYESGAITSRAFSRSFCDLIGLDVPYDEFATAWSDIFWLNEPVAAIARGLKGRGYPLLLGSNTNDLHAAHFRRRFAEALAPFDHLVLSFEVGHVKPAAGFFHACARAAGVDPGDCVFIDDLPENVEGARDVGLTGLVYRDAQSLVTDLRGVGVEVDGSQL